MSTSTRTTVRRSAALVAAPASLGLLTGCSVVHQQLGDAWAVTYEVTVDQPVGATLADVHVEGADGRGDAPREVDLGDRKTRKASDGGSRWTRELVVLAEDRASVRATPAAGATATCHILLDGGREIASDTSSAPGEPVRCSATTPTFD